MAEEEPASWMCLDALREKSILVYIKCIKHLRDLMIKARKLEEFNKLFSEYTFNGHNISLRIISLYNLFKGPYIDEVCNFLTELNFPLNFNNWSLTAITPHALRRGAHLNMSHVVQISLMLA